MKKRVLVIEDEKAINDLLCMNLEVAGYEPVAFFDGNELSKHIKLDCTYDLALLDIMLPGKNGFTLLEELKEKNIPVIYLTAKGDITSKVKGLKSGAEDYIVKPFDMLELLIRVEKVISRFNTKKDNIFIKDVSIDIDRRIVTKSGVEVALQPMEFDCQIGRAHV